MRSRFRICAAAAAAIAAPSLAQTATFTQTGPLAQTGTPGAIPASVQLFQRDWLLMNWALRNFDSDRDVLLSAEEAAKAAAAFKQIADGDGDGRVTRDEFRRGRDFILARY